MAEDVTVRILADTSGFTAQAQKAFDKAKADAAKGGGAGSAPAGGSAGGTGAGTGGGAGRAPAGGVAGLPGTPGGAAAATPQGMMAALGPLLVSAAAIAIVDKVVGTYLRGQAAQRHMQYEMTFAGANQAVGQSLARQAGGIEGKDAGWMAQSVLSEIPLLGRVLADNMKTASEQVKQQAESYKVAIVDARQGAMRLTAASGDIAATTRLGISQEEQEQQAKISRARQAVPSEIDKGYFESKDEFDVRRAAAERVQIEVEKAHRAIQQAQAVEMRMAGAMQAGTNQRSAAGSIAAGYGNQSMAAQWAFDPMASGRADILGDYTKGFAGIQAERNKWMAVPDSNPTKQFELTRLAREQQSLDMKAMISNRNLTMIGPSALSMRSAEAGGGFGNMSGADNTWTEMLKEIQAIRESITSLSKSAN